MQEFLLVLSSCRLSLSLDPIKRNQVGLGPEILVAKVNDHEDQSNNFHNADSGKL
jgi:hypothetical protein